MHHARWKRHGDPLIVLPRGNKLGTEKASTLRAVVHPSVKDIYWAAGFLEGEGAFNRAGKCNGSERVSANQVNYEPVGRMLKLFGGAAKHYQKKRSHIHKTQPSPVWDWYVSGARARGVMFTLYPLLSKKRQNQIRSALLLKAAA